MHIITLEMIKTDDFSPYMISTRKLLHQRELLHQKNMRKTSSQTRKMRYPAVKLTDCGKTCTLTKLQTAEPEKIKVKFV